MMLLNSLQKSIQKFLFIYFPKHLLHKTKEPGKVRSGSKKITAKVRDKYYTFIQMEKLHHAAVLQTKMNSFLSVQLMKTSKL